MKKMILSLALTGVLFGLGGCNSKTPPWDLGYGAYYPFGNYLIRTDGTKFTQIDFSYDLPLNRYYAFFNGAIPEGTLEQRGVGVTVPVTSLYDGSVPFPTYVSAGRDDSEYNDPLAGMVEIGGVPIASTGMNFLVFYPKFFRFTKNGTNPDYAECDFDVEISDEVRPGVQNDTVDMRLKFFNNRADGETIMPYDGQTVNSSAYINRLGGTTPFAFDLEGHNFDLTDGAGKNKTYIIKLSYQSYEWDETGTVDETKVYTKFLTCKWTPGDPYGQDVTE